MAEVKAFRTLVAIVMTMKKKEKYASDGNNDKLRMLLWMKVLLPNPSTQCSALY